MKRLTGILVVAALALTACGSSTRGQTAPQRLGGKRQSTTSISGASTTSSPAKQAEFHLAVPGTEPWKYEFVFRQQDVSLETSYCGNDVLPPGKVNIQALIRVKNLITDRPSPWPVATGGYLHLWIDGPGVPPASDAAGTYRMLIVPGRGIERFAVAFQFPNGGPTIDAGSESEPFRVCAVVNDPVADLAMYSVLVTNGPNDEQGGGYPTVQLARWPLR